LRRAHAALISSCSWACGRSKVMRNASVQQPLSTQPLPSPLSSRAKPRDLRFRGPFVEACSLPLHTDLSSRAELFLGSWSIQGDEKRLRPATTLYATIAVSFVIPSEAEGSAVPRTFRGSVQPSLHTDLPSRPELFLGLWPIQGDEKRLRPATTLYATIAVSFVIPSEAEGSAVPRTFPGSVQPSLHTR
jgi:hypothetical protein